MALTTISQLKEALSVGARPNLFEVTLAWPTGILDGASGTELTNQFTFLCKAAAIPAFTVGVIEVPFRGRRIKVPGDRTFADWTATALLDANQDLRFNLLKWNNWINTIDFNSTQKRPTGADGLDYTADILIKHLRTDGSVSRTYKLFEAFPIEVGTVDLAFDSTDAISEFTVTFQYHYLTALDGGDEANPDDGDDLNRSEETINVTSPT